MSLALLGIGTKAACHGTCLAMTSHNIGDAQRRLILPLSALRRPPAGAVRSGRKLPPPQYITERCVK